MISFIGKYVLDIMLRHYLRLEKITNYFSLTYSYRNDD